MSRKTRLAWANGLIAITTIAGGLALTQHFTQGGSAAGSSSTATGSSAQTATSSQPAAKSGTATSDAVAYQFGQVQLTVSESSGKITSIDYGTSSATGGREQAFSYLVQDAIAAQGTNFSNLSGATYTTDAFKQALS
ncbi:MAG: hypothetical protein RJA35_1383, partial [Actinomycetota bacterium]